MTPDTFQTVALAWVGSAAAVIIGVLLAVVKIMPMITALSAAHELNKQRITLMTDRLNGPLAINAGQHFLDNQHVPINLGQFIPGSSQAAGIRLDPTIQHNGLKTVFAALIEGAPTAGLTVGEYIASIEARLDAWVDSIG